VIAISLQDDKSTENWLLWYGESGGEVSGTGQANYSPI